MGKTDGAGAGTCLIDYLFCSRRGGRCKTRYSDQSNNEGRINTSIRIVSICALALAGVLFASTVSLAGETASGTIIAVAEDVVTIKADDGKEYEIAVADVVAEDLKTGDMVEYEIVEGEPVKVQKKK